MAEKEGENGDATNHSSEEVGVLNVRLHIRDNARSHELVQLADELEKWADSALDLEGCCCALDGEGMKDLQGGEFPKSAWLQMTGMLDKLNETLAKTEVKPISMTEHQREQLEAEMENPETRGFLGVLIQGVNKEAVESTFSTLEDALTANILARVERL